MAIYPIKMLKDEQGQPFVPLTHISAVSGEEYTTTVLVAAKQSAGHYKITNTDLNPIPLYPVFSISTILSLNFCWALSQIA